MERYRNLDGNSSITEFDIGSDYIAVKSSDGKIYRYTYRSTGSNKVEEMKRLARYGTGLNSYIMHFVKYDYEK